MSKKVYVRDDEIFMTRRLTLTIICDKNKKYCSDKCNYNTWDDEFGSSFCFLYVKRLDVHDEACVPLRCRGCRRDFK